MTPKFTYKYSTNISYYFSLSWSCLLSPQLVQSPRGKDTSHAYVSLPSICPQVDMSAFIYWMLMKKYRIKYKAYNKPHRIFLNLSVPRTTGKCMLPSEDAVTGNLFYCGQPFQSTGRRGKGSLPVTQENSSFRASLPLWVSWIIGFLLISRLFPVCIRCTLSRPVWLTCRNNGWVFVSHWALDHWKQEQRTLWIWWSYLGLSSALKLFGKCLNKVFHIDPCLHILQCHFDNTRH